MGNQPSAAEKRERARFLNASIVPPSFPSITPVGPAIVATLTSYTHSAFDRLVIPYETTASPSILKPRDSLIAYVRPSLSFHTSSATGNIAIFGEANPNINPNINPNFNQQTPDGTMGVANVATPTDTTVVYSVASLSTKGVNLAAVVLPTPSLALFAQLDSGVKESPTAAMIGARVLSSTSNIGATFSPATSTVTLDGTAKFSPTVQPVFQYTSSLSTLSSPQLTGLQAGVKVLVDDGGYGADPVAKPVRLTVSNDFQTNHLTAQISKDLTFDRATQLPTETRAASIRNTVKLKLRMTVPSGSTAAEIPHPIVGSAFWQANSNAGIAVVADSEQVTVGCIAHDFFVAGATVTGLYKMSRSGVPSLGICASVGAGLTEPPKGGGGDYEKRSIGMQPKTSIVEGNQQKQQQQPTVLRRLPRGAL